MLKVGMHTDNWRPLSGNFDQAVQSAIENDMSYIEFGTLDGAEFVQGLGYDPALPLEIDEIELKRHLDEKNLQVSQLDAAYPLTQPDSAQFGVPYVWRALRMAYIIDCPYVVTTDGGAKPEGYTDEEIIDMWRFNLDQVLKRAESYEVGLNIETHGPFTNNTELMAEILEEYDSPYLGVNFDTGNTFIAGNDPLDTLKKLRPWVRHLHIKDVPKEMIEESQGEETGIASSHVAIGQGANASNIEACINYLEETDWDGVVSVETLGTPNNIRESVNWIRSKISTEKASVT